MRLFLIFSLGLVMPGIVGAMPNIKISPQNFEHRKVVTIVGTGFGPKKTAAPLIWDDVESGAFHPNWASTNQLQVGSGLNQRHHQSQYNGYMNFTRSTNSAYFAASNDVYPDWFVQYWFKLGDDWDWGSTDHSGKDRFLSNIKVFRLWNPGSTDENFVVALNGWVNSIEYVMEGVRGEPNGKFLSGFKSKLKDGRWHLLQFAFGDNWGLDQKDGEFHAWVDGKLVVSDKKILTREDFPGYKRPFIIGLSEVWGPNSEKGETDKSPNSFYIDDIYMDNSWARIELGDNPIYESCSHREIQIPTEWSETKISFKVNVGSFVPGARAYLFVINDHGQSNTVGKPVIIQP